MVDQEKVVGLVHDLQTYVGHLRSIAKTNELDFLDDPLLIGSARYYLQISIETCINLANHIISTERLRAPKDYKDTFRVLSEADVITTDFSRKMRQLAGLRNLLVHLYWQVDDQMIYDGIRSELDDFETYVASILAYVECLPDDTEMNDDPYP